MACNCSRAVWIYIWHPYRCDISDNSDSSDSNNSIDSRQDKYVCKTLQKFVSVISII